MTRCMRSGMHSNPDGDEAMEQTNSVGRSICSLNAPRVIALWTLLLLCTESLEWARERDSMGLSVYPSVIPGANLALPTTRVTVHEQSRVSPQSQSGMSVCDAAEDPHTAGSQSLETSEAWTTAQVDVFAVSGLASTHTTPFARVVYAAAKSHEQRRRSDRRLVSVDSPSLCQRRQRERDGRFTALWAAYTSEVEGSSCQFQIPTAVDWIEVQIWNHFANEVDVFLGTASISLLQSRAAHQRHTQQKEGDLSTGAIWYPLQMSKQVGLTRLHLSVQLTITFHHDVSAFRMQQQIAQKLSSMATGNLDEGTDLAREVVDPTFTFTEPYLALDWSPVVSTSIRHIFFHASVPLVLQMLQVLVANAL